MLTLDKNGYPKLYEDKIEFAIRQVESGNPFFNPATGKFSFSPAGAKIVAGENIFRGLTTAYRKILFDRVKAMRANQIGAKVVNGQVVVALMKNGRLLHTFNAEVEQKKSAGSNTSNETKGTGFQLTTQIRDQIIEIARESNAYGDALRKLIEQKTEGQISPGDLAAIENAVNQQRINDLVDYLHQQMRITYHKEKISDAVRISVGRGYKKKTFANLETEQIQEVVERLQAKGWLESQVQESVVDALPEKEKKKLNVVHKEAVQPK